MMRLKSFGLAAVMIAACLPAAAQENLGALTYDDGVAAYNAGNYARAFKIWKFQAEWGDPQAQTGLGVMYYLGQGAPQSYNESLKWNRKAANQDQSYGQSNLAEIYEKGLGVEKDLREALRLYEKAAAQNNPDGIAGAKRVKAEIDKNKGAWPKVSRFPVANSSVPDGQTAYDAGDFEQAFAVYSFHAKRRDPLAQTFLGYLYDHGQGTYQSFLMGAYWHQMSANQGHVYGMVNYGNAYESGKGVLQTYEKAMELYRKAGEKGEVRGTQHATRLEAEMKGQVKTAPQFSWTPQTLTESMQLARDYADHTGFAVAAWSLTEDNFDERIEKGLVRFLDTNSVKDIVLEGKTYKQAIYQSEYLREQKFAAGYDGIQEVYRSQRHLRIYDCGSNSVHTWSYQIFGGNELTGKLNNYPSSGTDYLKMTHQKPGTVGGAMVDAVCKGIYAYKPK